MNSIWHNEQTVPGEWEKKHLRIFFQAIARYIEVLIPYSGSGNMDIDKEIKYWKGINDRISDEITKLKSEDESGKLPMYGKDYGKLLDILWKQYSSKKQLLEEKKRTILVEAAHQGASEELNNIRLLLGIGFWSQINRQKALIGSFYPTETIQTKEENTALQITIQNLYGQFAAYNYGSMVQKNNLPTVIALKEIVDMLVKSTLPDDKKSDALADAEVIQTQIKKTTPNKSVLEICLQSLQTAANLAQIYSTVEPHFHTIQHFISTLPLLR